MRHGIQQATGDIVITLDADGETDPAEIPKFIEPLLTGLDFTKGSHLNIFQADAIRCHIVTATHDLLHKSHLVDKDLPAYWLGAVNMLYEDARKTGCAL